uniref:Uncharacterized protein n=1 Tax=Sphaerodactylus townsendi TaxID=933632 RepID=A0ACB8F6V0_9SAUR
MGIAEAGWAPEEQSLKEEGPREAHRSELTVAAGDQSCVYEEAKAHGHAHTHTLPSRLLTWKVGIAAQDSTSPGLVSQPPWPTLTSRCLELLLQVMPSGTRRQRVLGHLQAGTGQGKGRRVADCRATVPSAPASSMAPGHTWSPSRIWSARGASHQVKQTSLLLLTAASLLSVAWLTSLSSPHRSVSPQDLSCVWMGRAGGSCRWVGTGISPPRQ